MIQPSPPVMWPINRSQKKQRHQRENAKMAHSKPKQKIAEPAKLHFFIMLIILGNYSHHSLHQMILGKDDNKTIAKAIHMHKMQFLLRSKRHNISHKDYVIRGRDA
ncbi:hypothetical protein [Iodidimonas muriae]|uniref:hypothetical protein n=1 Tax=Iodidimonas muriae TaxID=261467 RepID=UPI001230C036|nr:hypothetical protein [Iodidimonas muriae]